MAIVVIGNVFTQKRGIEVSNVAVTELLPDRLLTRSQAAEAAGVSTCTWDRLTAGGKTPKPISLTRGSVRFRQSDIAKWIELGCPDRRTYESLRGK